MTLAPSLPPANQQRELEKALLRFPERRLKHASDCGHSARLDLLEETGEPLCWTNLKGAVDTFDKLRAVPPAPDWASRRSYRTLLRTLALECARSFRGLGFEEDYRDKFETLISEWLAYIIEPVSSSHGFYLQQYRALDRTHYDGLVPKAQHPTRSCYRPEHLTIPEMELALLLFEERSTEPTLRQWAVAYPHLLWRVHLFLLQRYCFELLRPLRLALAGPSGKARSKAAWNLDRPSTRSGELACLWPRVGALTAVGYLAYLGSGDSVVEVAYGVGWYWALAAGAASLATLAVLIALEVFKLNRGVIDSWRQQVWPRSLSLLGPTLLWSTAQGAVLALGWYLRFHTSAAARAFDEAARPDFTTPIDPQTWTQAVSGFFAMVSIVALIGFVVQWLWDDKAATEPL